MTTLLLTPMILLPFLGAAVQAVVSRQASSRWFAFSASLFSSLIGLIVLAYGLAGLHTDVLVDRLPWVGSYSISYELAVDGMSRIAVLVVSLLFPVLIASEWDRSSGARGLYALLLVLQGSLLGAVCSQDLFLLFFFWSLSSIPVFFLVGIWGGAGKEAAAFRTLVTSAAGNALLFGALILIYYSKDPHTFLIRDLVQGGLPSRTIEVAGIPFSITGVAFLFVCLGMALRAPVWPLHGWFTRLQEEAPPAVAVAVAAAVVPCAIQIYTKLVHLLFPAVFAANSDWILLAGLINMILGALAAMSQRRLSSLFSCLVLIQVGLSLIALGSAQSSALVGMVYQQLSGGLALAGLGLLFGAIAAKRSSEIDLQANKTGGHALVMSAPVAGVVMALSLSTLAGVPGLGGFIGQSLTLMGSYARSPVVLVLAGGSLLLLTTCLFGVYRTLFLGGPSAELENEPGHELSLREKGFLLPLVVLMVVFGLYPKPLLDVIRPTAEGLLGSTTPVSAPASATESQVSAPSAAEPATESTPSIDAEGAAKE